MGNLDLENLIKAEMDNFDEGNLVLPICATGCHTDGWGQRGKGSCGWLLGVVIKEPCFVPPVLETVK